MANGDADGAEGATGAVISSGGLSEFSRMLSVFINCSKLKVSSCSACPMELASHVIPHEITAAYGCCVHAIWVKNCYCSHAGPTGAALLPHITLLAFMQIQWSLKRIEKNAGCLFRS